MNFNNREIFAALRPKEIGGVLRTLKFNYSYENIFLTKREKFEQYTFEKWLNFHKSSYTPEYIDLLVNTAKEFNNFLKGEDKKMG
ncbi:MAG: hypothetical protein MJ252_01765 [archaeon]|nr:hypothetical protein [archaeon]